LLYKKNENKRKRGRGWPIFIKLLLLCSTAILP